MGGKLLRFLKSHNVAFSAFGKGLMHGTRKGDCSNIGLLCVYLAQHQRWVHHIRHILLQGVGVKRVSLKSGNQDCMLLQRSFLFLIAVLHVLLNTPVITAPPVLDEMEHRFLISQRRLLDLNHPREWRVKMVGNQSAEEMEYPKLHKCVDLGEAYSAAYLTSKLHLMEVNIQRNLSMVRFSMIMFFSYSPLLV